MGESSNDRSSDEDICDYERQSLKNIREDQDLLCSLGKTRVVYVYNYSYALILLTLCANASPSTSLTTQRLY